MTDNHLTPPRVLVVDDEKRIRDGCTKMLLQRGFCVDQAASGEEGIAKIRAEHFDIILLDLMMPGISGFDVLAEVRELHPDTAIIVITGYATLEHSIESMKQGAFDFIPKPFSPQELRVVIDKALDHIRTLKDITREQTRLKVLVDRLGEGVLAVDAARRTVALANRAALRLLEVTAEDAVGRPVAEVLADGPLIEVIDQALDSPAEAPFEKTLELVHHQGEPDEAVLRVRVVPFRDRIGRNLGAVIVVQDATHDARVNRMKSDFVSMVSHEIRGPLNSVLMQLKVVLDGLAGEVTPKQREILTRSSERIHALVDMASDLLDLARIEAGLLALDKECLDVTAILEDQAALHRPRAESQGVSLTARPAEAPLPLLLANRAGLEEILSNLVTNAIKYSPDGGAVEVFAETAGREMIIGVRDSGLGLTPEERARIFDRFYRVKNEKTRRIPGTGLGLAIVKSIVEAHDGSIAVESEPGRGSTFLIRLPLGHP